MNAKDSEKRIVLTCAQPTGKIHLGNYFGAIQQWKTYLDNYECLFGIVDMHAITVPYEPSKLRKETLDWVAQYIACGLDPEKCSIFIQSHVTGHTELAWILGCLAPLGQLERMTQFKDKSKRQSQSVGAGLLFYPILMAADILLYNADIVPVGEDQKQHLELTRDLAIKFNQTYSETFKVPEVKIPKVGARIMSLQDPTKKMSKSDPNPQSVIFLWDEPNVIRKKVMSAVTDSGSDIKYDESKLGINNLLTIMHLTSKKEVKTIEEEFVGKGYGEFKATVAESLIEYLKPIQEKYNEVKEKKEYLQEIIKNASENAQKRAYKTLSKVYRKTGFLERIR